MNLTTATNKLMRNDKNATWNECTTIEELKEGLLESMKGYEEEEETYIFYKCILEKLQ